MTRRLAAWSIALLVGASTGCPAPGQESRPDPSPVATIDGAPIAQAELVRYLLEGNWETASQALVLEALLDLELKKAGLTVPEEAIDREQQRILERLYPGKPLAEAMRVGFPAETELKRQARVAAGWDEVFVAAQKLKRENVGNPQNTILKQLFIRQTMEGYDIRKRGENPPPPPGSVIEVREKGGKNFRLVVEGELAAFVLGLVKPGSLRDAVSDLVDGRLVDRELARAGKSVTHAEVEAWARSMSERYNPPFDWRMICQFKQTTPDRERERWRRIESWKRATGWRLNEEALQAFISANQAHFMGRQQPFSRFSHIFVRTRDPMTDREYSPEKAAAARKKIDDLWQKLEEGADFGALAERYSEDELTAKEQGRITAILTKPGEGMDPAFQAAASRLGPGEISPPVKAKLGWHIIRHDKTVTAGQRSAKKLEDPSYREWIVDEYETMLMKEWLSGVRSNAKIWVAPDSELAKLKKPR